MPAGWALKRGGAFQQWIWLLHVLYVTHVYTHTHTYIHVCNILSACVIYLYVYITHVCMHFIYTIYSYLSTNPKGEVERSHTKCKVFISSTTTSQRRFLERRR